MGEREREGGEREREEGAREKEGGGEIEIEEEVRTRKRGG